MRCLISAVLMACATSIDGFQMIPLSSVLGRSALFLSEVVDTETTPSAEESVAETELEAPPLSGLSMQDVRKVISKLDSSNFLSSLETIEPYLLNEAGATIYAKSIRRIAQKCKELDMTMPDGYAKEARATAKRREKQNIFIATKEEERMAREAEERAAAEEAEAAADASEQEEASSREGDDDKASE